VLNCTNGSSNHENKPLRAPFCTKTPALDVT